jgi:hypothetical protein
MEAFSNQTAHWMETQLATGSSLSIECELGSLIAAASDWTEDEAELGDLLDGLVETGWVQLSVG